MKKFLMVLAMVLVFGIGLSHANDFGSLQAFPLNSGQQQGVPVTAAGLKVKPLTVSAYDSSTSDVWPWFYVGDSVPLIGYFDVVGSGKVTVKFQFYDALGNYLGQSKGTFDMYDGPWYVSLGHSFDLPGIYTIKVSWIWAGGTMVKSMTTKVHIDDVPL
jgi:hypothetical protein